MQDVRVSFGTVTGRPDISQKDFAEMIGLEGETWGTYERGVSYPNVKTLQRLKKLTGVNLDFLISGEPEKSSKKPATPPHLQIHQGRR